MAVMSEKIYLNLRDFLDKLPGGFPSTESGVEIKILKKLFTPEQARIAMQLRPMPEPAAEIAPRLVLDVVQAAQKLEDMAREGLILRVRAGSQPLYMSLQFVVGIYEFHLNTLDRELAELMEEYFPSIAKGWGSTRTKQLRVVPVGSSVATDSAVSTYDQVRELVKGKTLIAVAPCICQKGQILLGNTCDRPTERCIVFDGAAQYYIENKMGRQISEPELFALLETCEENALVVSPTNAKNIMNICMCCGCCCGVLRVLKRFPRPAEHVQSSFQAKIDPERCTLCGTCVERCQMEAINEGDDTYRVNLDRCIGCGLCVPSCPADAIVLKEKAGIVTIPDTMMDMHIRIAKERGFM